MRVLGTLGTKTWRCGLSGRVRFWSWSIMADFKDYMRIDYTAGAGIDLTKPPADARASSGVTEPSNPCAQKSRAIIKLETRVTRVRLPPFSAT
ncbi:MAG TPA: hypothetical protein VNZ26_04320 [Vicinamibacterales bacterium]|jgi:hypothetical protein|nr:hypothetical protein [Vicinamibacterales bacterium]